MAATTPMIRAAFPFQSPLPSAQGSATAYQPVVTDPYQLRQAIQLAKKKQAKAYDVISEVMGEAIGKASQIQLGAFEEKAKLTKRPVKQHAPLSVGDWVRSIHANRLGKVVKVYPDGSASICWRDGEPQGEGLGHERMPSELLKRSRAPR